MEIGVSLRPGLDALASIQTFSFSSVEMASSTILLNQRSAVSMVSSSKVGKNPQNRTDKGFSVDPK